MCHGQEVLCVRGTVLSVTLGVCYIVQHWGFKHHWPQLNQGTYEWKGNIHYKYVYAGVCVCRFVCVFVYACVRACLCVQEHSSPMRWQDRPTLRSSLTILSTASSLPRPRWSNRQSCCSGSRWSMQNTYPKIDKKKFIKQNKNYTNRENYIYRKKKCENAKQSV